MLCLCAHLAVGKGGSSVVYVRVIAPSHSGVCAVLALVFPHPPVRLRVVLQEGARNGPSLMPGGPREAYHLLEPILSKIAAQVDGVPCVTYIGELGSGNYVKMVHNGIEYGDMQLIAEAYDILRSVRAMWLCWRAASPALRLLAHPCACDAQIGSFSNEELHKIFSDWNAGELESFLIEITANIFTKKDDVTGEGYLVDKILDKTGMKGAFLRIVRLCELLVEMVMRCSCC